MPIWTHDAHLGEILSPSAPRSFNLVAYLFYQYINGTNSAMLFLIMPKSSDGSLVQSGALDDLIEPAR